MTEQDFQLSEEMVTYWTNFMKTGNPNKSDAGQDVEKMWESYTKENPYVKVFE